MKTASLPYYGTFTGKFGQRNGAILYALIAIAVIIIIYRGVDEGWSAIQRLIGNRQQRKLSSFLEEQVMNTPDGVQPNDSDIVSFDNQAQVIADMQHQAMAGFGTNTSALFEQLIDLQGWQLVMVAEKFGVRPYNKVYTTADLNLFGWYDEELCNNCTFCLQYKDDRVPGCTTEDTTFWCNGCTERGFMRAIWEKTGIPN